MLLKRDLIPKDFSSNRREKCHPSLQETGDISRLIFANAINETKNSELYYKKVFICYNSQGARGFEITKTATCVRCIINVCRVVIKKYSAAGGRCITAKIFFLFCLRCDLLLSTYSKVLSCRKADLYSRYPVCCLLPCVENMSR